MNVYYLGLGILLSAFVTTPSWAAGKVYDLRCNADAKTMKEGFLVDFFLKGTLQNTDAGVWKLDAKTVDYTLWADDDEQEETVEYSTAGHNNKVYGNDEYKPLKYKKHIKFTLFSNEKKHTGKVEMIYPASTGNAKTMRAHLVLTNINDHVGGTVHDVTCTKILKK